MLQEIRGLAEVTHRQPQSKSPGLFLMQLRAHLSRRNGPQQRAFRIPIQSTEAPDFPRAVRISVRPNAAPPTGEPLLKTA